MELSIEIATIPIMTNIPPILETIIPLFSVIFYSADFDLKLFLSMNGNGSVYG
jgi:hypothetical protein